MIDRLENPYKGNEERFKLWNFLFQNGMNPLRATFWTLWHEDYDKEAHRQMNWLENTAINNPGILSQYTYFLFSVNDDNSDGSKIGRVVKGR